MSEATEQANDNNGGGLLDLAGEVGNKKIDAFKFSLNQGIAVTVVLVMLYFCLNVCSWLGTEIFIPARDRLFKHLDTIEQTLKTQEKATENVRSAIDSSAKVESENAERLDKITESEKEQTNILRDIRDQRRPMGSAVMAGSGPGNE